MSLDIHALRKRGITLVTICGWMVVLAIGIMAITLGRDAVYAAIVSALLNLIPSWCAVKGRTDRYARMAIGIMAALQPSLLLYAMQGSLWQIDMHLYFFVALASLTLMWDVRPIIAACAIILVHHALLSIVAPSWVFWGGGGFIRATIHAIATILIGSVLCWISIGLAKMMANIEQARQLSEAQAEELQKTSASLKDALAAVQAEQKASAQSRANTIRQRRAEYATVAAEFERTISGVTHAVAQTADMLERSAKGLKELAIEAETEASRVAGNAETASRAANTVAAGVAEMSISIAAIATNVSQQSELTARATKRSGGGGEAIGSLSQQSRTIGEATRAIVRIAERTNLLSLNAAIEAASAGVAGRGFTIVAQEVKALATQAGEAATEIDAFLSGVRSGTVEAEHSFKAIDSAIADLDETARSISYDVESQRQSADTIETFARNAADEADTMVGRTKSLFDRASAAGTLSSELETAAAKLSENVRNLERSTDSFMTNLNVG